MARAAKKSKKGEDGKRSRRVAVSWALVQGTMVVGRRWQQLSANERDRLRRLLRESGGRLDKLTAKERKELRKLVDKLDLKGMAQELVALRAVHKRRLRRR